MSTRFDIRLSNHFVSSHASEYEGAGDMTARRVDAMEGSKKLADAINTYLRRRERR
jgi:hypothetical protein